MTQQQSAAVRKMLAQCSEIHHGDCIGADFDCHVMAKEIGVRIIVHPPTNPKKRAFCQVDRPEDLLPTKDYRPRNYAIVDASRVLIATPKTMSEEHYSGTWLTVRYARRKHKQIRIVWPDGTVTKE